MYNEASRISWVLKVLTKVKNIWEIICIDDASSDNSIHIVQEKFPSVEVKKHKKNQWKTETIRTWVQASNYENILLCDADLQWLIVEEIEQAINIFFKKNADMIVLKRENAPFHIKIFRWHILITGERIVKKSDIINILNKITNSKKIKLSPWILENTINKYMMEEGKKCLWVPSSGTNTYKTKKYGIIKWLRKDWEMYTQMDLIENKFFTQIMKFDIYPGIQEDGIIDKILKKFEI